MGTLLISGVTRGIGLAIAKRFQREGFQIVGCGSSVESVEEIRRREPDFDVYVCDMRDKKQVQGFANEVVRRHPVIDVFINNVGKYVAGQIFEEGDGVFEDMMLTNVFSAYHLTRGILPCMMAQKRGSIFNICSVASVIAYSNGGSYCVSKFALLGFSKVLREEMKPHNIRVFSVLPGATKTDSWGDSELPDGRFISPGDIGELVWCMFSLGEGTVVEEVLIRPILGDIG